MDTIEGENMLRRIQHQLITVSFCLVATTAHSAGFIDTPDSCMMLDHVVQQKDIYLKPAGKCEGQPGRLYLETAEEGETKRVFVSDEFWAEKTVKPLEIADISGALAKSDLQAQDMKLPENRFAEDMQKTAQKTADYYNSDEFQAKLAKETERINKEVLGVPYDNYYKDAGAGSDDKAGTGGTLGNDERIYLFFSASMPMQTIRTYVNDIARLGSKNVTMVMRGFVGGMRTIGPTTNFITDILKINSACDMAGGEVCSMRTVNVIVDPLLFRKYDVNQVPAFVYVKGINVINPEMSEGKAANLGQVGTNLKMSGDVALKCVLTKFAEEAGTVNLKVMSNRL
jgi:type-F conjugative transfer system pilin assembly protein TrbC